MSQEESTLIFGIHPVEEALKNPSTGIDKIYLREGSRSTAHQRIFELASTNKVPLIQVPGRKLNELVGRVNDQGVVAQLSEISYTELEDYMSTLDMSSKPTIVLLSEIEDTHNFGAILRTAAAAGTDAIIVPKHRQAPVNAVVYKTSAGTAGKVPIIRVTNINQTVNLLKDAGFWFTGLDSDAPDDIWTHDFDYPVGLIIGSEGSGIRKKTLELCDFRLSIPMQNNVESLNASVSAAVVLYEISRKRFIKK
ncbi:MAG: 23S rRNA (guanosine(2251)-2'-O)-methyltransferase RlmB [Balneolales bacterium]|nr:23S rRNA (guanosine(2251)-2'-O)-methyltransferase RlmB [Balneolales bacterium]